MGFETNAASVLAAWDWTVPDLPVDSWWFFSVVLVLLIVVIWAVARLTTNTSDDIDPAEIDRQMLSAVSELRSQGELTHEEFRSIKSRLINRLAPGQDTKQPAEHHKDNENNKDDNKVSKNPTANPDVETANDIESSTGEDSSTDDTAT